MDGPLATLLSRLGYSPRLSYPQGNAQTRLKGLHCFRYAHPPRPRLFFPSRELIAELTILLADMVRFSRALPVLFRVPKTHFVANFFPALLCPG